jgi:hypothetical protein
MIGRLKNLCDLIPGDSFKFSPRGVTWDVFVKTKKCGRLNAVIQIKNPETGTFRTYSDRHNKWKSEVIVVSLME